LHADKSPPAETKLHDVAPVNNILTVFAAGGNKLYANSSTQECLSRVFVDEVECVQWMKRVIQNTQQRE
jgi:hypothetical protein